MDAGEMYTSLNKGVPSYIPIILDIEVLIRECADDVDAVTKTFKQIGNEHQKRIAKIAGMTKAQRSFFKKFRLWTNHGTATTNLFVCPTTLFDELKNILGVKEKITNDEELIIALKERVRHLFDIKTPEALQAEYPLIYEDYLLSLKASQQITKLTPHKPREVIREQWAFFNMYGLNTNFHQFMNRQRIMYSNLVAKSKQIEFNMNSNPIDLSLFGGLNKEKFELYLAHKYLEFAYSTENIRQKQECVYYLCTYIRETKYTEASITDEFGNVVTFDKLISKYRRLFRKNIELKPIDDDREKFTGLHISIVKTYVSRNYLNSINWHIVPKGRQLNKTGTVIIDSLNKKFRHLTPDEKRVAIAEAYAVYQRKMDFFESTDYVEKIYGSGQFNGYIAFFYHNGEVLMEKFFDDYAESVPAKHEAIYNLKVADFETLSKLSKTVLMHDSRCRRITHTRNWEVKARKVVDTPATDESKQEVQKVLRKIKLQKPII